jgi:hypothetical protein
MNFTAVQKQNYNLINYRLMIKNFKHIAIGSICAIMVIIGLVACEQDLCKTRGITCVNSGVCSRGVCSCPIDFEGDSCQFPVNKKFAGKYGGYRQIGYRTDLGNDTVYIIPDTFLVYTEENSNNKIRFISVYDPFLEWHAKIRVNELRTTDSVSLKDNYFWTGSGSLNGDLLYVDFDRDSLVNGVPYKNYRITLAGDKVE